MLYKKTMRHVINIAVCQHIDIYAVLCIKKNCAQSYWMSVSRIVPIAFLVRQENNGLLALPKVKVKLYNQARDGGVTVTYS